MLGLEDDGVSGSSDVAFNWARCPLRFPHGRNSADGLKREDAGAVPAASTTIQGHLGAVGGELGSTAQRDVRRGPLG